MLTARSRNRALAVAGAVLASATLATSASASVPGLELVRGSVNKPFTGLELPCPAGKEVVGVGGFVGDGDSGQVVLNDLTVQNGSSNVRVTALEDQDGFARAWQLKATAICADA